MIRITGKTSGDYFEFHCEDCGSQVKIEYLGHMRGSGVPEIKAICDQCKTDNIFKISSHYWNDNLYEMMIKVIKKAPEYILQKIEGANN